MRDTSMRDLLADDEEAAIVRAFMASRRSDADEPPLKAFSRSGSRRPRWEPPPRKGERGGADAGDFRDGLPLSQLRGLAGSLVDSWDSLDLGAGVISPGGGAEVVGCGFMARYMGVLVRDLRAARFGEHL
jgi:hypothetical protein